MLTDIFFNVLEKIPVPIIINKLTSSGTHSFVQTYTEPFRIA